MSQRTKAAELVHDGKRLYRIEVEQRQRAVLYVLATSDREARDDALELALDVPSNEWDDMDHDVDVALATSPPPNGSSVWSGGDDGDDLTWPLT